MVCSDDIQILTDRMVFWMSIADLITALKALSLEERAMVFESALGPLTSERLAALQLLPDYLPGGALYIDDGLVDFIDPDEYTPLP
jgi:hypothetical protein